MTEAEDERTVGLPVYEKLAVLNENGVDGYRERVFYYDSKGRAIQRVECDEDGDNLLRISNKYDFAATSSPSARVILMEVKRTISTAHSHMIRATVS